MGNNFGAISVYLNMQGLTSDGQPFIDSATGLPTPFNLAGDPVTGKGWIDGVRTAPGDRRFLMSAGPFSMKPGETQEFIIATIAAGGADRLSSVRRLRYYARYARAVYEKNFLLPEPAPVPLDYNSAKNRIELPTDPDMERGGADPPAQDAAARKTGASSGGYSIPRPDPGVYPNPIRTGAFPGQGSARCVTIAPLIGDAAIRVYGIEGNLVRTMHTSGNAGSAVWDLRDEIGLPIGSGVYFIHVELPALGVRKVLKLAAILETPPPAR